MEALKRMLQQRRVGFVMQEVMSGSHHFVDGAGPQGELPFEFRVHWGTRHLLPYLVPGKPGFLSNFLEGEVTVGGLVEGARCAGTLDLLYFTEGKIRYTFDFRDAAGKAYRYLGEKRDIRPWNLHRTHTTCYGTVTEVESGREVSQSITYFRFSSLPAFLASFHLA